MRISLDVLVEAKECFAILRNAEGNKRPLSGEEYRRTLYSFTVFETLVDALAREHEVEVTT